MIGWIDNFRTNLNPDRKLIQVKSSTYLIKIVRKRWYHKYINNEVQYDKTKLAEITTELYINKNSKLHVIPNEINLFEGEIMI